METRNEYSPKAIVRIRKGQGRSLKAGGAWIYDNEIESINGAFENGDMVTVEDFDGYPPGTGFINTKSKLTVRMMSAERIRSLTAIFWKCGCAVPGTTGRL